MAAKVLTSQRLIDEIANGRNKEKYQAAHRQRAVAKSTRVHGLHGRVLVRLSQAQSGDSAGCRTSNFKVEKSRIAKLQVLEPCCGESLLSSPSSSPELPCFMMAIISSVRAMVMIATKHRISARKGPDSSKSC